LQRQNLLGVERTTNVVGVGPLDLEGLAGGQRGLGGHGSAVDAGDTHRVGIEAPAVVGKTALLAAIADSVDVGAQPLGALCQQLSIRFPRNDSHQITSSLGNRSDSGALGPWCLSSVTISSPAAVRSAARTGHGSSVLSMIALRPAGRAEKSNTSDLPPIVAVMMSPSNVYSSGTSERWGEYLMRMIISMIQ